MKMTRISGDDKKIIKHFTVNFIRQNKEIDKDEFGDFAYTMGLYVVEQFDIRFKNLTQK